MMLFLIAGFIPLIYGASLLVDAASSLAKKYNIPNIVIGLTIVAFGTSMPELVVNILASMKGNSAIALGNIIGSNIFNVFVILGISAIIFPLSVKSGTTWIEIPLSFIAALAVFILANDALIDRTNASALTRIDGYILILFFIIFMAYNIMLMKSGSFDEAIETKNWPVWQSILLIIAGLTLLVIGGKIIVESAITFARDMGISERVIGLTIIAAGTSLPELATSTVAAKKKNVDIAIGNVVGSNIFNIFWILGLSSVLSPVLPQPMSNIDMIMNMAGSLLLFIFIFTGKGQQLDRWEGAVLLTLFTGYTTFLLIS